MLKRAHRTQSLDVLFLLRNNLFRVVTVAALSTYCRCCAHASDAVRRAALHARAAGVTASFFKKTSPVPNNRCRVRGGGGRGPASSLRAPLGLSPAEQASAPAADRVPAQTARCRRALRSAQRLDRSVAALAPEHAPRGGGGFSSVCLQHPAQSRRAVAGRGPTENRGRPPASSTPPERPAPFHLCI